MKRCPVCQSTYADDSLRFCLQDGATLESSAPVSEEFKTLVLPEDAAPRRELPPTEVLDLGAQPTAHERRPAPTAPERPRDTHHITEQAVTNEPRTRSTAAVVALTVVATMALLGLGGLSAWLLLKDRSGDTAQKAETENLNTTRPADNQNGAPSNSNSSARSNVNSTPTPTPASEPSPNMSAGEKEVRAALNGWLRSFRAGDLEDYMAHYAYSLDVYYNSRNVSVERVRADKERAFNKYSTFDVRLGDMRVQVDPTGERAVAIFNKAYRFTGPGVNSFEGSGLNRFTWEKIDGRWLITGEEDLSR